MPLDIRTHTIAQFVADYFANHAHDIDYSRFDCFWNEYVRKVADAGSLLEDSVQAALSRGREIEDWYNILEGATAAFREELLSSNGLPDDDVLIAKFALIVAANLELELSPTPPNATTPLKFHRRDYRIGH